jgi:HEAT repeat protein
MVGSAGSIRVALVAVLLTSSHLLAEAPDLRRLATAGDWRAIQSLGPGVMPELARIYSASSESERATIASVFYALGWKSPEAKRALMADAHTKNQPLRLQVQWALGRVSADPDVVDVLLDNMQNDLEPLFRDKAACALANDQIHLSPAQKIRLYEGLIGALDDPKPQVRQIAILALQILTGQNKGFDPGAPPEARSTATAAWQGWLTQYKRSVL